MEPNPIPTKINMIFLQVSMPACPPPHNTPPPNNQESTEPITTMTLILADEALLYCISYKTYYIIQSNDTIQIIT